MLLKIHTRPVLVLIKSGLRQARHPCMPSNGVGQHLIWWASFSSLIAFFLSANAPQSIISVECVLHWLSITHNANLEDIDGVSTSCS